MRIVILSDLQIPFHHKRAVAATLNFVTDIKPDMLLCVGDEADNIEVARWSKGAAIEYAGTFSKNVTAVADIMAQFRAAIGPDVPFHVSRSNHGDRIETYVERYAPALRGFYGLQVEELFGYDKQNITYHRKPFEFVPGWLLMHGDEGSLSRYAGGTAIGLARKAHKSVVCGHTHRAGIISESFGFSGKSHTITGMEVGNLMDLRQADYMKAGMANWQQAVGVIDVDERTVVPHVVPVQSDCSLAFEGKRYRP